MSNKDSVTKSKRINSIVHRLTWHNIGSSIGQCFAMGLFMFFILVIGWAAMTEYHSFGYFIDDSKRKFVSFKNIKELKYVIIKDGKEVLSADFYGPLLVIGSVIVAFFFFGLFMELLSIRSEMSHVRKQLRPINDLALKADALSKLSLEDIYTGKIDDITLTGGNINVAAKYEGKSDQNFADTAKLQQVEEAIEHISTDSVGHTTTEDGDLVSLEDNDLKGIEQAVNNLLMRLRESYQQQARFVNDASHELRTPIAVIQGYANMLDRWGRDDPKVLDEAISAISNEADAMNRLVEQLLFLARGDSGRTTLKVEDVNLNEMMKEIYEESFMIDEKHPYKFKPYIDPDKSRDKAQDVDSVMDEVVLDPLLVSADPALLKQAVRILVDNAAKYTNEKDEIVLGVGKNEEGSPYLMVQDTGIGMNNSDVKHMFERFYRSDEVRSYKGTGLGLSIAKWIVDKHKGHFEILSREGLGTRIRIIL